MRLNSQKLHQNTVNNMDEEITEVVKWKFSWKNVVVAYSTLQCTICKSRGKFVTTLSEEIDGIRAQK